MSESKPMTIAEASAQSRPTHTPTARCTSLLRHLTRHAVEILKEEEKPLEIWNEYIDALIAIPYSLTAADEYIVSMTEGDAPTKAHFALFAAAMYAVQATKADAAGERNTAWDLAFDASQWESFIEGVLAAGGASKMNDAVAERARKFVDAKRPKLSKTEFYEKVMAEVPDGENRKTADRIFDSAPVGDDGVAPFYWKSRSTLIDRSTDKPITRQQMTSQIQKARERHVKAKKTLRKVS